MNESRFEAIIDFFPYLASTEGWLGRFIQRAKDIQNEYDIHQVQITSSEILWIVSKKVRRMEP